MLCIHTQNKKNSVYKTIQQLTTRYSMVYMENDACPEKKDFLERIEDSQGIYHSTTMGKVKAANTQHTCKYV